MVVKHLTRMICSFEGSTWFDSRMLPDAKVKYANMAAVPLVRAWQRLHFYFLDKRFLVFQALTEDFGQTFAFNQVHFEHVSCG